MVRQGDFMESEIKDKVRPLYGEFQGYLSQAPTAASHPHATMKDKAIWNQYNEAVKLLSVATEKDYSRFEIKTMKYQNGASFIHLDTYKQKLGGLILRLHAEYFSNEIAPFSEMPNTIMSQTQQQNVTIQMILDIQSKIDEKLSKSKEGSKEKKFLNKLKKILSSIKNVNELIKEFMRLANEFGLGPKDILSLWS